MHCTLTLQIHWGKELELTVHVQSFHAMYLNLPTRALRQPPRANEKDLVRAHACMTHETRRDARMYRRQQRLVGGPRFGHDDELVRSDALIRHTERRHSPAA